MKNNFSRRQFIKNSALFVGAGMSFPAAANFRGRHQRARCVAGKNLRHRAARHFESGISRTFCGIAGRLGDAARLDQRLAPTAGGRLDRPPGKHGLSLRHLHVCRKIPPPPVKHGQNWWPYEQSGYFVDGAVRLNHLIEKADAKKIPAANIKYILENSGRASSANPSGAGRTPSSGARSWRNTARRATRKWRGR
jgi:hypothetical protein